MKVLIIDDDADIRSIARLSHQSRGGMDVIEAASGVEGVRKAQEERPDVILLDMMMPTMDGLETLAALRSQPATALTPVIFLTVEAVGDEVERYDGSWCGRRLSLRARACKPSARSNCTTRFRLTGICCSRRSARIRGLPYRWRLASNDARTNTRSRRSSAGTSEAVGPAELPQMRTARLAPST